MCPHLQTVSCLYWCRMSDPSQFQLQEERDNVKADIKQAKQEFRDAQVTGDEIAVAFWRKQLELLGEKELILL